MNNSDVESVTTNHNCIFTVRVFCKRIFDLKNSSIVVCTKIHSLYSLFLFPTINYYAVKFRDYTQTWLRCQLMAQTAQRCVLTDHCMWRPSCQPKPHRDKWKITGYALQYVSVSQINQCIRLVKTSFVSWLYTWILRFIEKDLCWEFTCDFFYLTVR